MTTSVSSVARALRFASYLPALVGCALLGTMPGCATYKKISPYPGGAPVEVSIGKRRLSDTNEMPAGAYYDEPHQIIVTGYQKGIITGAALFGVVGAMVAHGVNKSAGAARYSANAAQMGASLAVLMREALAEQLSGGAFPSIKSLVADGGELEITPYALFSIQKNGKARLHAMVAAELRGKSGQEPRWSVRYFARAPGEYTVEGTDSWAAEGRYTEGMKAALKRVTAVILSDLQGTLTEKRKVKAQGKYPFFDTNIELPVIVLSESDSEIVGRLAVPDAQMLGGTHILEKADYTIKAAEFKSPK